jgi:hypothetical protein
VYPWRVLSARRRHGCRGRSGPILACALFSACGRTPVEPYTGRDEGDLDLCGDRGEELACYTEVNRFAVAVLHYDRTVAGDIPPPGGAFSDPGAALGPPDFSFARPNTAVSTGNGGVLELGLGDCRLTNGGDRDPDLIVYEAGPFLETSAVLLRPADGTELVVDGVRSDGFLPIGQVTGLDGLDIDRLVPGVPACTLRFDAVRIEDDPAMGGWFSEATGVDIDAVEILALVPPDAD